MYFYQIKCFVYTQNGRMNKNNITTVNSVTSTFVDDNNVDKSHTYEVVPYQYPLHNITNGLYDIILHLA
jgi:hypothetical protein